MRAIMAAFDREAADDDQGPYAQRRGAGRADAGGAVAHALRGPGQAGAAGAARGRGPRGGGDRRGVRLAPERDDLAQRLGEAEERAGVAADQLQLGERQLAAAVGPGNAVVEGQLDL